MSVTSSLKLGVSHMVPGEQRQEGEHLLNTKKVNIIQPPKALYYSSNHNLAWY